MQIDLAKLNRLEEAARQAHVVVMDVDTRRNEARAEYQRQRKRLELDLKETNNAFLADKEAIRAWLERGCLFPLPKTEDGYWQNPMNQVADLKARVDDLTAEHSRAQERWRALTDPLGALRDFAAQYGRRREKIGARLANEAVEPGYALPELSPAAGYPPAEGASAAASVPAGPRQPAGPIAALKHLFSR
ncbi:hypothetical protein [Methylocaldum sp.]|uniref:hypothetical protein n=1 Tax=Methylocaldum sp. TaxID=1969727 RepID=UPI002D446397|nr:hypothetical protein [Methylocaldum sp.]HYE35381.1 hypothetical protein [Methylocaldum sp.]